MTSGGVTGIYKAMGRNATLDYARLIAAFGIVFFHSGAPGGNIAYAALPFFLILLIAMAVPAAEKTDFPTWIRSRAQRLLLPWLVWSGVYGTLKIVEVLLTSASISSEFATYMIFTGPALHLWFLPFAFVICVLIHPLSRLVAFNPYGVSPMFLAGCFGGIGVAILIVQQGQDMPIPYAQWLYALPAVCLGLSLAIMIRKPGYMWLILCGFVGGAMVTGAASGLMQLVIAAAAFILCTTWRHSETRLSDKAGAVAMGVYLAHPLIFSLLTRSLDISFGSLSLAVLGCLGALAVSVVIMELDTITCRIRSQSSASSKKNHL